MKDYCQNPLCYQYTSKDRLRGVKGSKVYQNRTIGTYAYGDRNFCTLHCQNDYLDIYMNRFIDYIGRLTETPTRPQHQTIEYWDIRDNLKRLKDNQ